MAGAPGGLKRILPLRTAVSTSAGLASAAVNFLAAVEVAQLAAGRWAWVAIAVAGLLIVGAASNFAELSGMYPTSAAIRVWMGRALGDQVARVGSLVYASTVLLVMGADAFVLAKAFSQAVPGIPGMAVVAVLLGVISAANLRGIRIAGWIQDLNALALLATLVVFSALVLWHHPLAAPAAAAGPATGGFWQAVAVGVFIYVGFEWVTPLAEEFRDARAIPRGMLIALGVVALAFALFTAAIEALSPGAGALGQSLAPQLWVGREAMGGVGYWWMMAMTLTTAGTTFNGGLATASRFVYALARERTLPRSWARLNQHLVPGRALIGLTVLALAIAVVVVATARYQFLVNTGAAVESFMYAVSALLVIRLRRKEATRLRPYRAWGGTWAIAGFGVVYLFLGFGALTTGPSAVPWPLVVMGGLIGAALGYVRWGVPHLGAVRERTWGEPS
ncbi:MAG: APC family permease [Firmicutes bacterium]|nr:APC family permease [Alicyclobacillaceae bacterium]MCL6497146.1 APC family permease [Bacillota bacterium]